MRTPSGPALLTTIEGNMYFLSKTLMRSGLTILAGAAAIGCSTSESLVTDPRSIAISLSDNGAIVPRGGARAVTATVTAAGGSPGNVRLTVTGAPSGVIARVSRMQTMGAVSTATVTIDVDAAARPAVYPLVVHATGSGVGEARQEFLLTIASGLGFTISLSTAVLTIGQGGGMPTTMVNVARVDHFGGVVLEVTGLPNGVTAAFDYAAPWLTGNSSVLTLTVDAAAVPGTYSLQVSASDPEQDGSSTTPLTLIVTGPPPVLGYSLALSASALSIARGTSAQITVNVVRQSFAGPVTLFVDDWNPCDGMPAGLTAGFSFNPVTGDSSVLTITVSAAAAPGVYELWVYSETAAGWFEGIPLTLTVTAAAH